MWIARQGKLSNAWSSAPSRGRHTRCLSDWSSDVCSSYPSRRRHTRCLSDWSSDVCSSDLPKIADAVVLSPREVMVNAKAPGHTTLLIWETGSDPARYEIEVTKDNSDWDGFRKLIQDSADGAAVSVTGSGDTIVLAGTVKSAEDSKRLAGMAQTRAKTVINLLKAPPPPDPRQILLQVKFVAVDRVALTQVG